MLNVTLDNVGKKFGREWIFSDVRLEIPSGSRLAILGGNGSGKSTLLQVIAGYVTPNKGSVLYSSGQHPVNTDQYHDMVSFASPYLQLIEEYTGLEMARHASKFKPFAGSSQAEEVLKIAELSHAQHKFIKHYSSGMKQRLKLALAILADTPLLLLDEPLSNLDRQGYEWYGKMISTWTTGRSIIVCSNTVPEEYAFCISSVQMGDYK